MAAAAGAREEAHRIADLCRDRGYKPTLLVNASSRDVQTEIFASDARVLHIAAHGQYSDNPFESGVVIGDNEYFTTANVAAMRRVPEFVFLNCCHLGSWSGQRNRQSLSRPWRRAWPKVHERGRARRDCRGLDGR